MFEFMQIQPNKGKVSASSLVGISNDY